MIHIKAIVALALAALGGATVGSDAYLASHSSSIPRTQKLDPPSPVAVLAPEAPPPREDAIVMLAPVHIVAAFPRRVTRQRVTAEPQEPPQLFVCSNWRPLESGPEGRGVRTLCVEKSPAPAVVPPDGRSAQIK